MRFRDSFEIRGKPVPGGGMKIGGYFWAKGIDAQGRPFRSVLKNGINLNALNSVLSVFFSGATQLTSWYMGLIDNASFTGLSNGDTMASHAGWIENIQYTGSNRPAWTTLTVGGQTITNVSNVLFTVNMNVVLAGLFLVSDNTLNGTTGTLWSTGLFPAGPQTLISGSPLDVGYTLTASPI